jgi:hypothetical protein
MKRRMFRVLLIFGIILAPAVVGMTSLGTVARACSCGTLPVCRAFWAASAVFVGEVVDMSSGSPVRFRIEQAYRGIEPGTTEIAIKNWRGTCGYPFSLHRARVER